MLEDIHKILKCPISGEPLRPMLVEDMTHVNEEIRQGTLYHINGQSVQRDVRAGYITQSGHIAYTVEEGVIVLLSSLAMLLDRRHITPNEKHITSYETEQVQAFYDQIGWRKTKDGKYEDTERFVDTRPVLNNYFGHCNNRIRKYIASSGKYLVDVACGPIHYDAYRSMSDGYDYRICIDVSLQALRDAQCQMGDKGIYLMADITNLPLQDQSVDSVISLHTVYHVAADRQMTALKEIHRILKPTATGVVIYSWGDHSLFMSTALLPIRGFNGLCSLLKRINSSPNVGEPQPYSYTHCYRFIKKQPFGFYIDVVVWSSISSDFTKTYITGGRFGRLILKVVWKLEEMFPQFAGRFGQYPLFVIKKSPGMIPIE